MSKDQEKLEKKAQKAVLSTSSTSPYLICSGEQTHLSSPLDSPKHFSASPSSQNLKSTATGIVFDQAMDHLTGQLAREVTANHPTVDDNISSTGYSMYPAMRIIPAEDDRAKALPSLFDDVRNPPQTTDLFICSNNANFMFPTDPYMPR